MRAARPSALARALAGYGIGSTRPLPQAPLPRDEFTSLVAECERHRVVGLLARAVADGAFPVDSRQHEELLGTVRRWHANVLRAEAVLVETVNVLSEAGIEYRVVKGSAVAHLDYPDPAFRVFGDVDVLVTSAALPAAAEALTRRLGASRPVPERTLGFDRRFERAITLVVDGIELDLHRTLVDGVFGARVNLRDLLSVGDSFELAGQRLACPSAEVRFLHACWSAVLGDHPPRLIAQRDVVQILGSPTLELGNALRMARRWRGPGVVARALQECEATLGIDLASARAAAGRVSPPERVIMAAYRNRYRGPLGQLTSLAGFATWGERRDYVLGLVSGFMRRRKSK